MRQTITGNHLRERQIASIDQPGLHLWHWLSRCCSSERPSSIMYWWFRSLPLNCRLWSHQLPLHWGQRQSQWGNWWSHSGRRSCLLLLSRWLQRSRWGCHSMAWGGLMTHTCFKTSSIERPKWLHLWGWCSQIRISRAKSRFSRWWRTIRIWWIRLCQMMARQRMHNLVKAMLGMCQKYILY